MSKKSLWSCGGVQCQKMEFQSCNKHLLNEVRTNKMLHWEGPSLIPRHHMVERKNPYSLFFDLQVHAMLMYKHKHIQTQRPKLI